MVPHTFDYKTLIHNPDNSVLCVTRQYIVSKKYDCVKADFIYLIKMIIMNIFFQL